LITLRRVQAVERPITDLGIGAKLNILKLESVTILGLQRVDLILEARFVAQTACFFYMFRSLPETFGRIEVMELELLLAYPSAAPRKAVAGLKPCSGFFLVREGQIVRQRVIFFLNRVRQLVIFRGGTVSAFGCRKISIFI
jgi:hypothetical protein